MTQIFLDTASTDEIHRFLSQGIGAGVTTNQKIILSEGSIDLKERIVEICALKPEWPVSVETTTKTVDALVAEAEEYAGWHPNVVVKVAMDKDGVALKVAKKLQEMGIRTNLTAMVTINQLYLAAGAGATYVSLFFNRARDAGIDPVAAIEKVVPLLERDTESQLICGSIRKPEDVEEILCAGAHIVTIPPKVLTQMPFHSKTEETIREFDQAWSAFTGKNHTRTPVSAVADREETPVARPHDGIPALAGKVVGTGPEAEAR
jgi:transaldolase